MSDNDSTSRRTVLKFGALASVGAVAGGAGLTTAQSESEGPIVIDQYPHQEYVVIRNTGEDDVDLTGYSLNFDAEGGNDQIGELAGDVVLEAGAGSAITVGTGEQTTIDPDVSLTEPYSGTLSPTTDRTRSRCSIATATRLLDPDR